MSDKNFTVDGTFRNSENSKSSAESSFDRRDSYLTVISLGILAAFLPDDIFISPISWSRSRHKSRHVFGRREFHLTEILAEISVLISPRFWPPRFSSHQDLGRDLGTDLAAFLAAEIFISPRFWPRSRY